MCCAVRKLMSQAHSVSRAPAPLLALPLGARKVLMFLEFMLASPPGQFLPQGSQWSVMTRNLLRKENKILGTTDPGDL